MHNDSKCDKMKAIEFPLDRQGTLYVDGVMHSEGIFDLNSGLYVSDIRYSLDIPSGTEIILMADDGQRIEIASIAICPTGEAHHHFSI